MAGIYFHIPWCRKVCIYCDFHFSVSMRNKPEMIECMKHEIELRQNYLLNNTPVSTVYFGGGTPSVLSPDEIKQFIDKTAGALGICRDAEITLEANPDDLSPEYINGLIDSGINRLSIGVQSFHDDDLTWMNRRHNSTQSRKCIEDSLNAGFDNINIDLIYGIPGMRMKRWIDNLNIAFSYKVRHISAYHLTLEPKTVYNHRVSKGLLSPPDESAGRDQFCILMELSEKQGYEHYEISNFALPGFHSLHNTAYWLQEPYLGIGPSAHSFDGRSRQWNIRNNNVYINSIGKGLIPCETEYIDEIKGYNEYVMTSLRTWYGIDILIVESRFGASFRDHLMKEARVMIENGVLVFTDNKIRLTRDGKFIADGIIASLFV